MRRLDDVDPKVLGAPRNAGFVTNEVLEDTPETGDLRKEGPRLTAAGLDTLWLDELLSEEM